MFFYHLGMEKTFWYNFSATKSNITMMDNPCIQNFNLQLLRAIKRRFPTLLYSWVKNLNLKNWKLNEGHISEFQLEISDYEIGEKQNGGALGLHYRKNGGWLKFWLKTLWWSEGVIGDEEEG